MSRAESLFAHEWRAFLVFPRYVCSVLLGIIVPKELAKENFNHGRLSRSAIFLPAKYIDERLVSEKSARTFVIIDKLIGRSMGR